MVFFDIDEMDEAYRKIKRQTEEYDMIRPGDVVLAAVSGGADSICMLRNLKRYADEIGGIVLETVHVEHGIRGEESLADAAFTEDLCRKLGIKCRTYHVDAPAYAREHGQTLEEAARNLRYRMFDRAADEAASEHGTAPERIRIATAHSACDQAETMLFDMIRGSKSRGLCGIPPVRGRIIRPLLTVTREEIEDCLADMQQDYCTDSTNADDNFARNVIRHRILPELIGINSETLAHMGELAGHMLLVREDIDARTEDFLTEHVCFTDDGKARIEIKSLAGESALLQTEIIHACLERQAGTRKDITSDHVAMVLALSRGETGKRADLPYGLLARTEYGTLVIEKKRDEVAGDAIACPDEVLIDVRRDGDYELAGYRIAVRLCSAGESAALAADPGLASKNAYTKIFDCDKIKSDAKVRFRRAGDYLYLGADGRRKKLKDFFIDEKVPLSDRDSTPLLTCGSEVLWAVGFRMGGTAMIRPDTTRCVSITIERTEPEIGETI